MIEVGCGNSSCVTLDTNELFFENNIETTFIEPFTQNLYSLIKEKDYKNINIIDTPIQDVPLEIFKNLEENGILFIDSTHLSKMNSDVNYIIHNPS